MSFCLRAHVTNRQKNSVGIHFQVNDMQVLFFFYRRMCEPGFPRRRRRRDSCGMPSMADSMYQW